jgi:hypothetical protein
MIDLPDDGTSYRSQTYGSLLDLCSCGPRLTTDHRKWSCGKLLEGQVGIFHVISQESLVAALLLLRVIFRFVRMMIDDRDLEGWIMFPVFLSSLE